MFLTTKKTLTIVSLLFIMGMIISLSGCSSGNNENVISNKGEASTSNPISIKDNVQAFEDELGIAVSSAGFPENTHYAIIGNKVAQITYDVQESGLPVIAEITIRATKDTQTAENLSGIYDESMKELDNTQIGDILVSVKESPETASWIYSWKVNDVFWEMCYHGTMNKDIETAQLANVVESSRG